MLNHCCRVKAPKKQTAAYPGCNIHLSGLRTSLAQLCPIHYIWWLLCWCGRPGDVPQLQVWLRWHKETFNSCPSVWLSHQSHTFLQNSFIEMSHEWNEKSIQNTYQHISFQTPQSSVSSQRWFSPCLHLLPGPAVDGERQFAWVTDTLSKQLILQ